MFRWKSWLGAIGLAAALGGAAQAQEMRLFSIGTGGTGATYYPLGGTIANAISNPPGSRPCDEGGSCGVEGLIAIAQSSKGSVENLQGIVSGAFDSGFSQSDIAYWAYTGTGLFDGQPPMDQLRVIAALYPEHIQLIARSAAGVGDIGALRGKRVSLDEKGSGSYANAVQILGAYGLSEADLEASYLKSVPAGTAVIAGDIDAFFITAGYPTNAIIELAEQAEITLVPIDGAEAEEIVSAFPFYSRDRIPAGTYAGIGATETLAVGAQWITSADTDEDLVYAIVKALWNDRSRTLLDVGHAKGASVTLDTALEGVAIPLHPGAERFYREIGLID
jgi:TRAP transporter TAXI family solute receptor